MIGIIIGTLAFLFTIYFFWRAGHNDDMAGVGIVVGFFIGILAFMLIGLPITHMTGGLVPEYSTGSRDGYITKLSEKGLIWKTYEGEMQQGSGNMAALQGTYKFSVRNSTLLPELLDARNNAQRVRLNYSEYLFTDWTVSESGYLLTSIEVLDE